MGNSAGLASVLGQRGFPIRTYGQDHDRVQKLRAIAETDEGLLPLMSVCWRDTSQGGNCGHCAKCVMTRRNLRAIGLADGRMFPDAPPLDAALRTLKPARQAQRQRGDLLRLSENLWHLPDGPLREIVASKVAELTQRLNGSRPRWRLSR